MRSTGKCPRELSALAAPRACVSALPWRPRWKGSLSVSRAFVQQPLPGASRASQGPGSPEWHFPPFVRALSSHFSSPWVTSSLYGGMLLGPSGHFLPGHCGSHRAYPLGPREDLVVLRVRVASQQELAGTQLSRAMAMSWTDCESCTSPRNHPPFPPPRSLFKGRGCCWGEKAGE